MVDNRTILELAKRLKAISQTGITYATDDYNLERYAEVGDISSKLLALLTGEQLHKISEFYLNLKEYPTPKTDIRAVVVNENREMLLVKEKSDGRWSLPGGWAEIGYSPREVIVKEVKEETGFVVKPERLLAVMDKRMHPHPPQPEYVYKLFIACTIISGEVTSSHDIAAVGFFSLENLPALSEVRITYPQIKLMFDYLSEPAKAVYFD